MSAHINDTTVHLVMSSQIQGQPIINSRVNFKITVREFQISLQLWRWRNSHFSEMIGWRTKTIIRTIGEQYLEPLKSQTRYRGANLSDKVKWDNILDKRSHSEYQMRTLILCFLDGPHDLYLYIPNAVMCDVECPCHLIVT